MFLLSRLSIKSKLTVMLLSVSLGSVFAIGWLSWNRAQANLRSSIFDELEVVRNSKARQVESYFELLRNHLASLSEDRMIVEAMVEFRKGFRGLSGEYVPPEWNQAIQTYYTEKFFPFLKPNISGELEFEVYSPKEQNALYLQYHYLAQNANEFGQEEQLIDPEDGSEYSRIHARYHEILRDLADRFSYRDLYLIDAETGDIVYSVEKNPDFATSLKSGPYRESNFGALIDAVEENAEKGAIQLVDFRPYRPVQAFPAAFMAAPIYNGPYLVGILAVQLPVGELNRILTSGQNWQADGLGNTGETYIVGSDYLMRSNSRFLLEQTEEYLDIQRELGTDPRILNLMQRLQTSILLQRVNTAAVNQALEGVTGTNNNSSIEDYRDRWVLSAFAPLDIEGVNWTVVSQIDRGEAFAPLRNLTIYIFVSAVVISTIVTAIAVLSAILFVRPLDIAIAAARRVSEGELDARIPERSEDEFGELAKAFNQLIDNIGQKASIVEQKSQESDALLQNLVPQSIAERLRKGEERIAEEVQQVSIIAIGLVGFNDIARDRTVAEAADILDDLFTMFDDVAERHAVDQINAFSDRYIATCGLTAPRIDHTKRVLEFAFEVASNLQEFEREHKAIFGLRVGVHTGSVMSGVVGRKKFGYNLWGEAVSVANYLHLAAKPNTVLVSGDVREQLQDLYDFSAAGTVSYEGIGRIPVWEFSLQPQQLALVAVGKEGDAFDTHAPDVDIEPDDPDM